MPEAKAAKAKAKPRGAKPRTPARKPAAAAPAAAGGSTAPRRSARRGAAAGGQLTIEQYRSGICCIERQKRTLRALGLRHPRQRVVRPDNAAIRGMVKAIPHLVRIVES